MCTVSVLRGPDLWHDDHDGPAWRVAFNRDERRTRVAARPPQLRAFGGVQVALPIDPDGAGTWISATSAGLVFALLNEIDLPAARRSDVVFESRGLVIPSLVVCRSLDEVVSQMSKRPIGRCRPYRLLAISDTGIVEVVEGLERQVARFAPTARFVRTSSTAAPAETARRRMALFDSLVPTPAATAQDAFHRHQWDNDLPSSVLMERADARTVSVTTVEAFAHGFRMTYRPWPSGTADVTEVRRAA